MKESDLYPAVKRLLESQGYEVKGEIGNCDVLAVRGKESPVVVELKRALTLDVILQAVERLSVTQTVYIGVPAPCAALKRRPRHLIKMLRMLGLGLLLIGRGKGKQNGVKVILDPGPYAPRISTPRQKRLLGEFHRRVGDPNLGGKEKRKGIMTAYRQQALSIARFLEIQGPAKASDVARALAVPKARDILYRDVYGWFDRVARGIYDLSPRGRQEIGQWPAGAEDGRLLN